MIPVDGDAATDPREALDKAIYCIREGRWDARSLDGARTNALESIAWSLAGLLARQVAGEGMKAEEPESATETLSEALNRSGFVPLTSRDKS